MTLLVALKATDGLVLAVDSKGTFGDPRFAMSQNDRMNKAHLLTPNVALLISGTGEVGTMLVSIVKAQLTKGGTIGVSEVLEFVRETAREQYNKWFPTVPAIQPFALAQGGQVPLRPELNFLIGGYEIDGTPRIFGLGSAFDFSPMLHDYGFAVQGITQYAIYLLTRLYKLECDVSGLVNLAVHVITETANQDTRVGGPVTVIVIKPGTEGCKLAPDKVIQIQEENRLRAAAMQKKFYEPLDLTN